MGKVSNSPVDKENLFRNRAFSNALYSRNLNIAERKQLFYDYGIPINIGEAVAPITYEQIAFIISYLEEELAQKKTEDCIHDAQDVQAQEPLKEKLSILIDGTLKISAQHSGGIMEGPQGTFYFCPHCGAELLESKMTMKNFIDPIYYIKHEADCAYAIARSLAEERGKEIEKELKYD